MGSRSARLTPGLAAAGLLLAVLTAMHDAAAADTAWPRCRPSRDDGCPRLYLNVVTSQGDAALTVERRCRGHWRHRWGRADARQTIRQWLDARAAGAMGGVCIPLEDRVNEIRVSSLGGHCGYGDGEVAAPAIGAGLRSGGPGAITLAGCHARIGEAAFGGIALRFADGYGFGDAYAAGYFYGVYDGFGRRGVGSTGASVWRISEFNTFHYRIEILACGHAAWGWNDDDDDDGR